MSASPSPMAQAFTRSSCSPSSQVTTRWYDSSQKILTNLIMASGCTTSGSSMPCLRTSDSQLWLTTLPYESIPTKPKRAESDGAGAGPGAPTRGTPGGNLCTWTPENVTRLAVLRPAGAAGPALLPGALEGVVVCLRT